VTGGDICVDHVGADEPGSAGDQNSHGQDCNGFTWLQWLRPSDSRSR
jgi:hypothetical protein